METVILKTIRSAVVFCAALFALAARAADYYWTGHAGNNLWHDRNNWSTVSCSDAEGVNVPSSDLSDQTTAKTYVFALTADTTITADVNVVAGWHLDALTFRFASITSFLISEMPRFVHSST